MTQTKGPRPWKVQLEATPANVFTWQVIAGLALLREGGYVDLNLRPAAGDGALRSQSVRLRVYDSETGTSTSVEIDLRDGRTLDDRPAGSPSTWSSSEPW